MNKDATKEHKNEVRISNGSDVDFVLVFNGSFQDAANKFFNDLVIHRSMHRNNIITKLGIEQN